MLFLHHILINSHRILYSTIQTPVSTPVSAAAKSTVNYYQWTVLQDIDAIFAPHFNSHRILVVVPSILQYRRQYLLLPNQRYMYTCMVMNGIGNEWTLIILLILFIQNVQSATPHLPRKVHIPVLYYLIYSDCSLIRTM